MSNHLKNSYKIILPIICLILLICKQAIPQNYPDLDEIPEPYNQIAVDAKKGHVDLAITKLNILIKNNPNDFFSYYVRAMVYSFHAGLYDNAIQDYNKLFKLTEGININQVVTILIYAYRSDAYYLKGDYNKAIKDVTESISLSESIEEGHKFLSILYSLLGKYNSAKEMHQLAIIHFTKAIELGSNAGFTYWGIGYSFHETGQKEKADFFFKKVSNIEPANDGHYLYKPISLKTKYFISKRINVASEYLSVPEETLSKALVYLNTYSGDISLRKLTRKIQYLLTELGYDPGPIDGIVGQKTRSAIFKFETDYSFPVVGQISEELYDRLSASMKVSNKDGIKSVKTTGDTPSLIKRIIPAIVNIEGYSENDKTLITGSGFFVSKNLIITNYHVIEKANYLAITTYDGKKIPVKKIESVNRNHDLALIKIEQSYQASPIIQIEKEQPQIGERILVIGSPLGFEQTVSDGIISGIRKFKGNIKLIQITAPISHGSSGGPVINQKGKVIGVATISITEGQNLNFAVSSQYITDIMNQAK